MDKTKIKLFLCLNWICTLIANTKYKGMLLYKGFTLKKFSNAKIILKELSRFHVGKPEFDKKRVKRTLLEMQENSELCIEGVVTLESGCSILLQKNSSFHIQDCTYIKTGASISIGKNATIGKNVWISDEVFINANTLMIGDNVRIGFGCRIIGDISIPDNTMIPNETIIES